MSNRMQGRSQSRAVFHAEKNAFYQPRQLLMLCIWFFVTTIYVARTFTAIQRAGLINAGPNQFGDFHFHHWAIVFVVLPCLMILAFTLHGRRGASKEIREAYAFVWLGISICLALFIDGILYYDSAIFFEPNSMSLQPVTSKDLMFQLFLGLVWISLTVILFSIMYKKYRDSNPKHKH